MDLCEAYNKIAHWEPDNIDPCDLIGCPSCGDIHTITEWDIATVRSFGSPITLMIEGMAGEEDEFFYTCPSCENISPCHMIADYKRRSL